MQKIDSKPRISARFPTSFRALKYWCNAKLQKVSASYWKEVGSGFPLLKTRITQRSAVLDYVRAALPTGLRRRWSAPALIRAD